MIETQTATIKLLIVDDNERVRRSLKLVFEEFSDFDVVGVAASGSEAVALTSELLPDVVLTDIIMSGMNGLATARMIRQNHPHVRVVLLSSYEDSRFVAEAQQAGVSAYLLKSVSMEDLAEALRRAYHNLPGSFPPDR